MFPPHRFFAKNLAGGRKGSLAVGEGVAEKIFLGHVSDFEKSISANKINGSDEIGGFRVPCTVPKGTCILSAICTIIRVSGRERFRRVASGL